MTLQGTGRVFSSGEAETLYVSIPSAVATDSAFPFEEGETVTVSIEGDEVRVTSTEEEEGKSENRQEARERRYLPSEGKQP